MHLKPHFVNGNKKLLSWAVENLVKNGIDASKDANSEINIYLKTEGNIFIIDIINMYGGFEVSLCRVNH